jgi:hypothetical protein
MTGFRAALAKKLPGLVWKTPAEIARDCPIPTALRYYQKKMCEAGPFFKDSKKSANT